MKRKSLTLSEGERAVKAILEDRLAKTPYQVWGKTRLASAIEKEPNEYLPGDLFSYLRGAEIDYVILHREAPNHPLLAVEFDGPLHEADPKVRRNDLLKNRLCRSAALPLLRVRDKEVEPLFTRDSFLSYIVEVVLRYKSLQFLKNYARNPDQPTESGVDEIHRHTLLDVQRLQNELAQKHRMFHQAAEADSALSEFDFFPGAVDYSSSDTDGIYDGHLTLSRVERTQPRPRWPVIHRISKSISLRTHYRTTAEPRPPWPKDSLDLPALEAHVKWLETDPWYSPDIPGISWLYVAWNLLEGLCLRQLLHDADAGKVPLQ